MPFIKNVDNYNLLKNSNTFYVKYKINFKKIYYLKEFLILVFIFILLIYSYYLKNIY